MREAIEKTKDFRFKTKAVIEYCKGKGIEKSEVAIKVRLRREREISKENEQSTTVPSQT